MTDLQPNTGGVDEMGGPFPFVRSNVDTGRLLADFHLAHRNQNVELPLRISLMAGFCVARGDCPGGSSSSGGHSADVIVLDALGAVVFDSTLADRFDSRAWSESLWAFEWGTSDVSCIAVVNRGDPSADGYIEYPPEIRPEDGVLDERCSEVAPTGLDSLIVNDASFSGDIVLEEGYNTAISVTERVSGVRKVVRLSVSFAAGGGEGIFPDCLDPQPVLRTINKVGPDQAGNINLVASGCYRWDQPAALVDDESGRFVVPVPGRLDLRNDCPPCCECQDYENTNLAIARLWSEYSEIAARATISRDLFIANRARWLSYRDCSINRAASIDLVAPVTPYVDLLATWTNASETCQFGVLLNVTLQHSRGIGGAVSPGTTFRTISGHLLPYRLSGGYPSFTAAWESVGSGETIRLRFRIRADNYNLGDFMSAVLTPYVAGAAQPSVRITKPMGARSP